MATIEQGSRGVLIVEDDPDIRETIAQILEEEGYEVRGASNGKQALDLLREGARPQLILLDLPEASIAPVFAAAKRVARAIEPALSAEGSFVAMNNKISQSVPHLHVHVVPRRKKDGLRGFFWPRAKYTSDEEMARVAESLRAALRSPA